LKQKDDDTIEEMEKHGPLMKVVWYLPIIPRMKHLFETQMMFGMHMRENMMACTAIQLILFNGRNLMTSLVKSQEIFDLV